MNDSPPKAVIVYCIYCIVFILIWLLPYLTECIGITVADHLLVLPSNQKFFGSFPKKHVVGSKHLFSKCPLNPDDLLIDFTKIPNFASHNSPPRDIITNEQTVRYSSITNATFHHLRNLYVGSNLLTSNGTHIFRIGNDGSSSYWYRDQPGIVIANYTHVCAIGNVFSFYGHFFVDVVAPLMFIPEEYRNKSIIIINKLKPYKIEILTHLGFERKRLVNLQRNNWIYAENIYTLTPHPIFRYPGITYKNIGETLKKAYGVDKYKLCLYVVSNRAPSEIRKIKDFYYLVTCIRKQFPNYRWDIIPDKFKSFKEVALVYAQIKLIFTITGSNLVRILFMNPGSVVVSAQLNFNDYNMQAMALSNGVKYIAYFDPRYDHTHHGYLELDHKDVMRVIKIGLYAAVNGTIPKNSTEYPYVKM
ncbi:hypothetical protein TVAG_010280 [Trichomonas vaginalis G3]|uniref:Glycosyltransferase 61 catalytic domain-containing protein n=1 Tax=Trichomonas vaginalis (strain ATCC PRA-98 / G3) TaxID=412133 RepID=A2FA43_TRIV3|nr:glycosyltransferase family [Trichomonas vaginalis G3]EAX98251.1 hypothetical protein TVAG_010280 [Trichomonas vaginalis G3]KAI5543392.1 glycosyltransferase family [Trichomonas vaginalis G3]|eukprot:XP_001311181.1 hypothetical protein [Trichomonas vaginalis G3]